jgi:excisionase family DNA binding protein
MATGEDRALLSTSEAAKALGVERSTLSRWAKRRYVVPVQTTLGGHHRWDLDRLREQVVAFQRRQQES